MTSSRKSLERRLEALEEPTVYDDLPMLTLAGLIAAEEIETVDEERRIYRLDGELREDTTELDAKLLDQL
ncbi:MAG: hypothetical protein ACNA7R_20390 [Natronococcus sp.]